MVMLMDCNLDSMANRKVNHVGNKVTSFQHLANLASQYSTTILVTFQMHPIVPKARNLDHLASFQKWEQQATNLHHKLEFQIAMESLMRDSLMMALLRDQRTFLSFP